MRMRGYLPARLAFPLEKMLASDNRLLTVAGRFADVNADDEPGARTVRKPENFLLSGTPAAENHQDVEHISQLCRYRRAGIPGPRCDWYSKEESNRANATKKYSAW